jgi:hypothetical protein
MRTKFTPVAILRNGVLLLEGNMVYADRRGRWLYVSEDGMNVYMYSDVAELIIDLYKKDNNDDYVVTGWDMEPLRFTAFTGDAYRYYNERFE